MNSRKSLALAASILSLLLLPAATRAQNLTVTNGLQLWLKADAGVITNASGAVTGWADQSPNQNSAAQADEALAPKLIPNAQNGKPVVRFDGTDDYLDVPPAPSLALIGDISTFFVIKFDDFDNYRAVWAQTVNNIPGPNDYYVLPNTGIPRAFRGDGGASLGAVDAIAPVRAGNYVVLGYQMGGTTLTHFLNGQAIGSGEITAPLADGGTALKIGSRDDLFTKMKGDIAELLIFDRPLTDTERASLVNYLQTKYGIANQAPAINFTAPTATEVAAPAVVTLAANATDSDGVITKVDFFANGALLGTATAAPYQMQVRLETAGSVTFHAVATDNRDAVARATNTVLRVTGAASSPSLTATNGLQLWLKADAGITPGGNSSVTSWNDQSGNSHHALQSDESMAPVLIENAVNGRPAVRFDGSDDYLEAASTPGLAITGDIASFFVVKFDDFATFRAVWGKTAGNVPRPTDYYVLPTSGIPRLYRGSDDANANVSVDGSPVPAGSFVILGFKQAGSAVTHHQNGSISGRGQFNITPTDSETPLKIGTRDDFATRMKGDIAELLLFNRAVSESEEAELALYLASRYGIPIVRSSNSLPSISITAPSAGTNIAAPSSVTVTASAEDSDGSIVRVDFLANGGLVGSATRAPFQVQFPVPVAGNLALTAVATDNLGGETTSAPIAISATGGGFAPPVAQGLKLWLKADAGVITNTTGGVSRWGDFSGNYNIAFQNDSASAPLLKRQGLNQLPTVQFDGANDFLEIAHSASLGNTGDITSVFVVKFDDFATFRNVWSKTAGNQPRSTDYYVQPNSIPRLIRGGPGGIASVDGAEIPAAEFAIVGFSMAGPAVTHYLDGAATGTGEITSTLADAGNPLRIGARADSGTRLKGELAELLIFDSALSQSDLDKVTQYLRAKYFGNAPIQPEFSGVRLQGNQLVLEWTTGAVLQEATTVSGPWTPVANAISPLSVPTTGQQKFYRLTQ